MQPLLLTVGLALLGSLRAEAESLESLESASQESEVTAGLETGWAARASVDPAAGAQVSGGWYTAAMASSNPDLIRPGGHFWVFINTLDMRGADLHGEILIPQENGCQKVDLVAYSAGAPNQFFLDFWGQNHLFLEAEQEHLIFYTVNRDQETNLVVTLMTRTPQAEQAVLDEFKAKCEFLGLQGEQITVVETTDRCQQFRD